MTGILFLIETIFSNIFTWYYLKKKSSSSFFFSIFEIQNQFEHLKKNMILIVDVFFDFRIPKNALW